MVARIISAPNSRKSPSHERAVLQMSHGQTINKQKLEQRSDYGLNDPALESRQDKRSFSSPKCPVRLWVPPSSLFNRYRGIFPAAKSGRGDKLTTHLHHPEPSLRMNWAVRPRPFCAFRQWAGTFSPSHHFGTFASTAGGQWLPAITLRKKPLFWIWPVLCSIKSRQE